MPVNSDHWVERQSNGYAVRCFDCCQPNANALHSGPWQDLIEAENRALKAQQKVRKSRAR